MTSPPPAPGEARAEALGAAPGRPRSVDRLAGIVASSRGIDARVLAAIRCHRLVVAVLACYALAAVIVPTFTPVATTDDWAYTRSVEILVRDGRLTIFPVVAATAVFQVVWGALFALPFGASFGAVRLSTVVMVGLGGWALYGLCRQLGVSRDRSALGVASYLFNPLTFVLAFTFMTDPHFASLLLVATFFYARGLEPGTAGMRATWWGSGVAALAFLTRQQGALIPLAVLAYLLVARRLRPNRAGLLLVLRVVGLPATAAAAYYLWLRFVNDVPQVQASFLRDAVDAGWGDTWLMARRLTFVELMYLGFFALPVVAAALPSGRRLAGSIPRPGWLLVCAWGAALGAGLAIFGAAGRRMPYVPQFLGSGGPGPPDVLGSRPRLLEDGVRDGITAVCAVASLVLVLLLARTVRAGATPDRATAGLVLAIGLWQVVGVLPPSYRYRDWAISLDRYLLPLLPFALCLALWALRDVRLMSPVGWLVVAAFAVYAVAGTRDYLVYLRGTWDLAHAANAAGVANERLDAGSAWDGYHLYEYGLANGIAPRTRHGPWWVYFYAPATDSSYVVAGATRPGYVLVTERAYSSWLKTEPTKLYLLRREGVPWPP